MSIKKRIYCLSMVCRMTTWLALWIICAVLKRLIGQWSPCDLLLWIYWLKEKVTSSCPQTPFSRAHLKQSKYIFLTILSWLVCATFLSSFYCKFIRWRKLDVTCSWSFLMTAVCMLTYKQTMFLLYSKIHFLRHIVNFFFTFFFKLSMRETFMIFWLLSQQN